jgi:uncharacterized protein (TIGR02246 family)
LEEAISEEIALKFVEKINSQDADGLSKLMTEDFIFVDYEGEAYEGREVMREGFAEYFRSYPEYRISVERVCVSGADVAFIAKTAGSHVSPDLEKDETLIFIAQVRDGLVAGWRIYTDLEYVKERLRKSQAREIP